MIIAFLSSAHLIAVFMSFGISYARSMERFDDGGKETLLDSALNMVVNVLWFPCLQFARAADIHNDLAEWFMVLLNSSLWGIGMYIVGVATMKRHRQRAQHR